MSAVKAINIYKAIDFQLRIEAGPDSGKAYRIHPPKISLGRDPKNQIAVTDPRASRTQFTITFEDNIVLRDESSRKTTVVNGRQAPSYNLVPGDLIAFGDTKIRFIAKSKQNKPAVVAQPGQPAVKTKGKGQVPAAAQSPGGMPAIPGAAPNNRPKPFFIILVAVIVLGALLFLLDTPPGGKEETLTTTEELNQQITDSKEFQERLKEAFLEKKKISREEYQTKVEQHFVRGFRDYQAGNYTRALQAFGAAVAKDPQHQKALRYGQLARQKREEIIEKHLYDGELYRSKMMFSRCAAEFEKAMVWMNRPNHIKYKLAKERYQECTLLTSGGRL